jgi:hypothetical protein
MRLLGQERMCEGAQRIGAREHPHDPPFPVHHGKAADALIRHALRGLFEGGLWMSHLGEVRHELPHGVAPDELAVSELDV